VKFDIAGVVCGPHSKIYASVAKSGLRMRNDFDYDIRGWASVDPI
jgi:hypothetical protein